MAKDVFLFPADDGVHGIEAWGSDGFTAVRLVADVATGAGSSTPIGFVTAGSRVYFQANDNRTGAEPWSVKKSFVKKMFNLPENEAPSSSSSQSGGFSVGEDVSLLETF